MPPLKKKCCLWINCSFDFFLSPEEEMKLRPKGWALPRPKAIHHIVEDFLTEWDGPVSHIQPLRRFLEHCVKTDLRTFYAGKVVVSQLICFLPPSNIWSSECGSSTWRHLFRNLWVTVGGTKSCALGIKDVLQMVVWLIPMSFRIMFPLLPYLPQAATVLPARILEATGCRWQQSAVAALWRCWTDAFWTWFRHIRGGLCIPQLPGTSWSLCVFRTETWLLIVC